MKAYIYGALLGLVIATAGFCVKQYFNPSSTQQANIEQNQSTALQKSKNFLSLYDTMYCKKNFQSNKEQIKTFVAESFYKDNFENEEEPSGIPDELTDYKQSIDETASQYLGKDKGYTTILLDTEIMEDATYVSTVIIKMDDNMKIVEFQKIRHDSYF